MGRARASMQLIRSKKTRRTTFEKRSASLKKKAYELSQLCAVEVCMIIFPDVVEPIEPDIWPQNPHHIHNLIQTFKKSSQDDNQCKISDVSVFFKDRIKKADADLARLRKKTLEAKFPTWGAMYDNLSDEDVRKLDSFLREKLEAMRSRVDLLKGAQAFSTETSGNVMMTTMDPSCDYSSQLQQHQDHNSSCMIQNWSFSNGTTDNMGFEVLQQQPQASNVQDIRYSMSYPNQFHDRTPAPYELGASGYGGYGVDGSYYVPAAMQQVAPLHLQQLWGGTFSVSEPKIDRNEF